MPQPDAIRLQHMLDSARVAQMLASGKTREDLTRDIGLVLALMKSVENIGEAAGKLSNRFREEHAVIPWDRIAIGSSTPTTTSTGTSYGRPWSRTCPR